MQSCQWDGAYKLTLALMGKNSPCGGSGFVVCFLVVFYFLIFLALCQPKKEELLIIHFKLGFFGK